MPSLRAWKNTTDRTSISVDSGAESQSGRVSDVVSHKDASFNPDTTNPQSAREKTQQNEGQHQKEGALEFSAANPDISNPKGAKDEISGGRKGGNSGDGKASGVGNGPKAGK